MDEYDQDGNRVLARNAKGGFDFHRYQESMGKCICGKDRWHPEHFNGDGAAAKLAMDAEQKKRNDWADWSTKLRPGAPVMVSDEHPTESMRGMIGTVVEISTDFSKQKSVAQVRFPDRQVGIVTKWLTQPPLPEPPPRFASQEEADQWLEDTAKEMGIRTEPVVPRFTSPEEADEWMRRQQGEPYVPPSWQTDDDAVDADRELDQRIFDLLQRSIKPMKDLGSANAFGTMTHQQLQETMKKVRGPHPQLVILDEAIDTSATTADDVIDPYA